MDEPFAALDALTRDEMQRLLAEVWRETRKTVIYVTHNVAEAVYLADRVIVMTPHPGTVQATIDITLPRPRDPLSVNSLSIRSDCSDRLASTSGRQALRSIASGIAHTGNARHGRRRAHCNREPARVALPPQPKRFVQRNRMPSREKGTAPCRPRRSAPPPFAIRNDRA